MLASAIFTVGVDNNPLFVWNAMTFLGSQLFVHWHRHTVHPI